MVRKLFYTLICLLFITGNVFAASVILNPQFYAQVGGTPVSGGKLYTYECGTTNAKTTYTTYTEGTANANPVILDSNGEASVYASGCLKLVLKTSADASVWSVDNVYSFDQTQIQDADRDTKVQTEESADEDVIRFDVGGSQKMYIDSDGVHIGTTVTTEGYGRVMRPKFAYKDGDEIYIGAGAYHHSGTSEQLVYWTSQLTFMGESDGSNSDNDDFTGSGWYYLYLDDSAIVTQASALLDEDCFLLVDDEPTYSAAKFGWYGSGTDKATANDRCIFAVYQDAISGDIQGPWFHDGGRKVSNYASSTALAATDVDVASTTVTLPTINAPSFVTNVDISGSLEAKTSDDVVIAYWSGLGSSNDVYLTRLERIGTDQVVGFSGINIFVDSDRKFDVSTARNGDDELFIAVDGWYLPAGM